MAPPPEAEGPSYQEYSGTVSEVTQDEIILVNASLSEEHGTPIVDRVPLVSGMFKSVGIGANEIGTVRVPIAKIASFHVDDASRTQTLGNRPSPEVNGIAHSWDRVSR
jgi:hypothetical protein